MALNGIDISNWQRGINLEAVPCDFVICKATQGTGYTSPDCVRQVEQAISLGKLWGVYHYVGGQGAVAEADFFVDSVSNWVGKGVLVIDWEQGQNAAWGDLGYLEALVERVIERTGVAPVIYASQSVFPWELAKRLGCGAWVAQYANNDATGYQESPWNEGAYACAIRQYSSTGRLPGWGGDLDLNKAYMDAEAWMLYADPSGAAKPPEPEPTAPDAVDVTDLAAKVMQGEYGDGDDRRAALGDRYGEVQSLINHIAAASAETLAEEVWAGRYGNGSKRRALLGGRADEVQSLINGDVRKYTVRGGDTLSGIASAHGTTWQALQRANGIADPGVIYPGQVLVIP